MIEPFFIIASTLFKVSLFLGIAIVVIFTRIVGAKGNNSWLCQVKRSILDSFVLRA